MLDVLPYNYNDSMLMTLSQASTALFSVLPTVVLSRPTLLYIQFCIHHHHKDWLIEDKGISLPS